jgi:hypothetical protein
MPYRIVHKDSGCLVKHGRHAFSKNPIPCATAEKQRTAIILSSLRRRNLIPPR